MGGFYSGLEVAGMADHVGIGVVYENKTVIILVQFLYDCVSDFISAHFRNIGVRGSVFRRDKDLFFSRKRFLQASVEKIGHVSVFFGFGYFKLFYLVVRDDLAHAAAYFLRGKDYRGVEFLAVSDHGNKVHRRVVFFREFIELGRSKSPGDLSGPVFSEIKKDDYVIFFNSGQGFVVIVSDNHGFQVFVA